MIFSVIFYFFGILVRQVAFVLQGISFTLPDWIESGITEYFAYARYLQGYLPMYADPGLTGLAQDIGLFEIIGFLFTFFALYASVKVIFKVVSLIRGVNIRPN